MRCATRFAVASSCGVVAAGSFLNRNREAAAFKELVALESAESSEWKGQCQAINDDCVDKKEEFKRQVDANIAELEAEYMRQKDILDGKVSDHTAEKKDVAAQQKVVAKEAAQVNDAKKTVDKYAHCPPELEQARAQLADLQAMPNKSPKDVDAECELQKKVLRLEACEAEFKAAEKVLTKEKSEHRNENQDLASENSEEQAAARQVPPSKEATADAKAAWEAAKAKGYAGIERIEDQCQADRDALEAKADEEIRALSDDYATQKSKLDGLMSKHSNEKADVVSQQKSVAREQKDVSPAQKAVDAKAHCPADLEAAEAELARLQAIPNKANKDVDAECKVRKQVLELKACVEELRAAEETLKKEKSDHSDEKRDLQEEAKQEAEAASKVPPQKSVTDAALSALNAAKAARKGICEGPNEKAPPAPKKEEKPEPKSGAATVSTTVAVFAVLFTSLLRA